MGLTKEQKAGLRQARILQRISEPGGSTSGRLAKELGTGRGMIINDIRDLRRKGYPIQVSSMVTEDGWTVLGTDSVGAVLPESKSKW